MTTPTPRTDEVERKHGLAWFGLRDELGRYQDGMVRFRELARQLERDLAAAQEELGVMRVDLAFHKAEAAAAQEALAEEREGRRLAVEQGDSLAWQLQEAQEARQAAEELAERSTRRLVEMSEPGFIGAFAARDAAVERAQAAEAHEAETHRTLGAILGTDDSLEQCAKRLLERAQAAEALAESYRKDAEKWRLMFDSARVSAVGSAGLGDKSEGNYAHLCLNFWTMHEPATGVDPLAQEWIDGYLAKARAAIAGEPK